MGIIVFFDIGVVVAVIVVFLLVVDAGAQPILEAAAAAPEHMMTVFIVLIVLEAALHLYLLVHNLLAESRARTPIRNRVGTTIVLVIGFLLELFRCLVVAITICQGLGIADANPSGFIETIVAPFAFVINLIPWFLLVVLSEIPRVFQVCNIADSPCTGREKAIYLVIGAANTAGLSFLVNGLVNLSFGESLWAIMHALLADVIPFLP